MTDYEHLVFYKKVAPQIFWQYYTKHNQDFPDCFAVTYDKSGKELFYIYEKLWEAS